MITSSVSRCELSPFQVARELNTLIDHGAEVRVAGLARSQPGMLFRRRLKAKYKLELFNTRFYLTDVLQIPELRFFVGYVVQPLRGQITIFPRVFYKDLSLAWRSASHFAYEEDGELWIGKGDVRHVLRDGYEFSESVESTTDLPLEIQSAMEQVLAISDPAKHGSLKILELILRQGPPDRTEPYADFSRPRRIAAENPKNLINRGRSIARFKKPGDPGSLWVASGYEPNFRSGIIERSTSTSTLYGGKLHRFRILSTNRKIQYFFLGGPTHVWIIPPQATSVELTSYGVRAIDVIADDDLFIPGYEYHHEFESDNGTQTYSQIPAGFAGEACPFDDAKADASPWLDRIPMIIQFRKQVLKSLS